MLLERLTGLLFKGLSAIDEVHVTMDEIIGGEKQDRIDGRIVTVFDSTSVVIAGIAIAKLIYDKVKRANSYMSVGLV